MTKVLVRHVQVSHGKPDDDDYKEVELKPGDPVPSWAEDYMEDEWFEDREDGYVAAGTDLVSTDHTWMATCKAADKIGVEYKKSWSQAQIASAINHFLFAEDVKDRGGEVEYDPAADAALFDDTNAEGNVMAPDNGSKAKAAPAKSESKSGGSNA